MTKVTVRDLRAAGICDRSKVWFRRHGLDYAQFQACGIDADILRSTGDAQYQVGRAIAEAEKREQKDGSP